MSNTPTSIAALYVDTVRGPYPHLPNVDCWDKTRDALNFPGGKAVIAHPPCAPWSRMRHFATKQHIYKHLATVAVHQVLANGGILEHPHCSLLWKTCGLPHPQKDIPDSAPKLWSLEIDQCRFGHKARKLTWLLFCGIRPEDLPPLPAPREPTHVTVDSKYGRRKGMKRIPEKERHLTPPDFAKWLVATARCCQTDCALMPEVTA